jgi:hypothetical protein
MEAERRDEAGAPLRDARQRRARGLPALVVAGSALGVSLCAAFVEAQGPLPAEIEKKAAALDHTGRGALMRHYLKLADLARKPRAQAEYAKMLGAQPGAGGHAAPNAEVSAKSAALTSEPPPKASAKGKPGPAGAADKSALAAAAVDAGSAPGAAAPASGADAAASLRACASNLLTAAATAGDGKDPYDKNICASCTGHSTLCLSASTGQPFCPGRFPTSVDAGQTLTINVFGQKDLDQVGQVSVTITTFSPNDGLTNDTQNADTGAPSSSDAGPGQGATDAGAPPSGSNGDAGATAPGSDGGDAAPGGSDGGAPPPPLSPDEEDQLKQLAALCPKLDQAPKVAYVQVVSKSVQVPTDARVKALTITTTNQRDDVGSGSVEVKVNHGYYYLEAGVLVSFIPGGSRKIVTSPLPGAGGQKTITVAEDLQVTPAVVLNAFPGGRRRALYSPFEVLAPRTALDLFGLQGGIGLNFSQAPTFFFGGVVEPVTGLSLNGGVALVQAQFVPANYAANMLLPQGETLTPDTRYRVRGYFGITATTDVVNLVSNALTGAPHLTF